MLNTGTTTWTSGGNYHVGSQNPQDNTTWGSNRANLSAEPVGPNRVGTFNFTATAPTVTIPTQYQFSWKTVQDGVEWFGAPCQKTITVNPVAPQLKALQITRGATANRTAGTYGVSGLNTTQGGSGYYNSLQIAQSLDNATDDNVALVGIAFTQSSGSPGTGASLQQLMDHVRTTNGFILLSVNKTRTINGQPLARGNYYVYYRNSTQWQPLPARISGVLNAIVLPTSTFITPAFDVELYSGLGSRTWGTYGYLMDTNNRETSAPQPASPTLP